MTSFLTLLLAWLCLALILSPAIGAFIEKGRG